jgi:hypothetical protein
VPRQAPWPGRMLRRAERPAAAARPSRLSTSRLLPDSNERPRLRVVLRVALHVAIVRTLYLRVRYGGWCVVSRGTRLKIGPGSRLLIPEGSFLFLGFAHFTPAPCAVHRGRGATLSVRGTVQILRGSRVFVHDGARLQIGKGAVIAADSVVTSAVPAHTLAAGNPARTVREEVSWRY